VLTPSGKRLVAKGGALLENRFAALVETVGVSYGDYRDSTVRLVAALSTGGEGVSGVTRRPAQANTAPRQRRASS
jgi:hypothetical protein